MYQDAIQNNKNIYYVIISSYIVDLYLDMKLTTHSAIT